MKAKWYDHEFKNFKYILNIELEFAQSFKYILTSSSFVELESLMSKFYNLTLHKYKFSHKLIKHLNPTRHTQICEKKEVSHV